MNTLLHVMEAYTELYRVIKELEYDKNYKEYLRDRLNEILQIFRTKVYNPEKGRLEVFFDADYNTLIDLYSFGHDIEASWLIDRTVDILEEQGTEYDMSDITRVLAKNIYEVAFDENGVPAESENGVVLETRIWWVQCESVLGFLNAYNRDNTQTRYLQAVYKIWEFIKEHMIDRREGSEWYSEIRPDNTPIETKAMADLWKCPYHNGRMYLEMLGLI
jgi:mannobiose 2-epimerase